MNEEFMHFFSSIKLINNIVFNMIISGIFSWNSGYCWNGNQCSLCSNWNPGQYLFSGSWIQWQAGRYSTTNNASSCNQWPAGQTNNYGNTGCAYWSPGYYNPNTGDYCRNLLLYLYF